MKKINLKIITPERLVYQNEVDEISISTESGMVGILPDHIPLVSIIKAGELIVKKDEEILPLAVSGGVLEVKPNGQVIILADHSEFAHEIDLAKAEEACARAKKIMEEKKAAGDIDFARFESLMEKELSRIKISGKYGNRRA